MISASAVDCHLIAEISESDKIIKHILQSLIIFQKYKNLKYEHWKLTLQKNEQKNSDITSA